MFTQAVIATATQTIKVTTRTRRRGAAASSSTTCPTCGKSMRSPGRPKGSKDSAPRKTRSDKGKKRGPYKKKGGGGEA